MKRFLIAITIILSPLAATAQWAPDYSQQMLEQQRQQTAAQQQMLQEMQAQRMQQQSYQQQQQLDNWLPRHEQRGAFGSFMDGCERGRGR